MLQTNPSALSPSSLLSRCCRASGFAGFAEQDEASNIHNGSIHTVASNGFRRPYNGGANGTLIVQHLPWYMTLNSIRFDGSPTVVATKAAESLIREDCAMCLRYHRWRHWNRYPHAQQFDVSVAQP